MRRIFTGLCAFALVAAGALLFASAGLASGHKTDICHKGQSINVATAALPAHLAHGDTVGLCCADVDADEDGFTLCDDCDDANESINPDAEEVCGDEVDNDCDGDTDCSDADCADAAVCAPSCGAPGEPCCVDPDGTRTCDAGYSCNDGECTPTP